MALTPEQVWAARTTANTFLKGLFGFLMGPDDNSAMFCPPDGQGIVGDRVNIKLANLESGGIRRPKTLAAGYGGQDTTADPDLWEHVVTLGDGRWDVKHTYNNERLNRNDTRKQKSEKTWRDIKDWLERGRTLHMTGTAATSLTSRDTLFNAVVARDTGHIKYPKNANTGLVDAASDADAATQNKFALFTYQTLYDLLPLLMSKGGFGVGANVPEPITYEGMDRWVVECNTTAMTQLTESLTASGISFNEVSKLQLQAGAGVEDTVLWNIPAVKWNRFLVIPNPEMPPGLTAGAFIPNVARAVVYGRKAMCMATGEGFSLQKLFRITKDEAHDTEEWQIKSRFGASATLDKDGNSWAAITVPHYDPNMTQAVIDYYWTPATLLA